MSMLIIQDPDSRKAINSGRLIANDLRSAFSSVPERMLLAREGRLIYNGDAKTAKADFIQAGGITR
jgi:hypothetical protein